MSARLPIDLVGLKALCARWNIRRLDLFGSVLRDDFGPDSDVDVLVTFAPDTHYGFFALFDLEQELEGLLRRKVDLVTRPAIERSRNPIRRDAILSSAETVYVAP